VDPTPFCDCRGTGERKKYWDPRDSPPSLLLIGEGPQRASLDFSKKKRENKGLNSFRKRRKRNKLALRRVGYSSDSYKSRGRREILIGFNQGKGIGILSIIDVNVGERKSGGPYESGKRILFFLTG